MAGAGGVGEEGAVDALGELSLQAPEGFGSAVAGVESPLVVVASGAWADGLGVRGEMDGVVELAVAVAGQSVAHDVAAAGFDGCGACVAGEVVGAGSERPAAMASSTNTNRPPDPVTTPFRAPTRLIDELGAHGCRAVEFLNTANALLNQRPPSADRHG